MFTQLISFVEFVQGKSDLFTRFMLLNEEGGEEQFTDKNFRDILLNFILAGRDTTAVTLSWFVYMMTMHPHVADKIFQELLTLDAELNAVNRSGDINSKSEPEPRNEEDYFNERISQFSELLTFDTLLKLQYLHACILETLRLYPAVPMVTEYLHPDVLPCFHIIVYYQYVHITNPVECYDMDMDGPYIT